MPTRSRNWPAIPGSVSIIIRDYMLRGLLHPVAHTGSGYNLFDEQSIHRLLFLRAAPACNRTATRRRMK